MTKWKVEYLEGVLAGIVKEGCSSPFVTMHYSDAEAVVQEHNKEIEVGTEKAVQDFLCKDKV